MNLIYTKEEREKILNNMAIEQREYLANTLKRGRATAFANALLKSGETPTDIQNEPLLFSPENYTKTDWELVEIIDAGKVDSNLKCECGRPLRYQYIVKNRRTEAILKLGRTHLTMHMGIPDDIAKAVINDLMKIDFELDEILNKFELRRTLGENNNMYEYWKKHLFLFDEDIVEQFELGIPFLNKQIKKLSEIVSKYIKQKDIQETMKEPYHHNNTQTQLFEVDFASLDFNDTHNNEPATITNVSLKQDHWTNRMEICNAIQATDTYRYDLFNDILVLLNNDINSANSIVEKLLDKEKYQQLFSRCTRRMCYLIVTARITEAKLSGEAIERESLADRTDTYYFLKT